MPEPVSRRDFLRLAGLAGLAGLGKISGINPAVLQRTLHPLAPLPLVVPEFPQAERLARVCVGKVDLKARPDENAATLGSLYQDEVVPWLREAVGPRQYYINQRWVETPQGYIYAPYVQPVRNLPNQPVTALPATDLGEGMWAEITVPFTEVELNAAPSSNSWVSAMVEVGVPVRVYYQMVFWVDRIRVNDFGQVQYRANPNYYGGVDMFWVPAAAMRPITPEEVTPINPDAENKKVVVDVLHQTLACYEGDREVYYCRASTGAKFDAYGNPVEKWSTPVGRHRVQRKYLTVQMSGGTTGAGYDLPGIGWTTIFAIGGVAIHSTFWHNDYGVPRSHGCVNLLPDDAKWVFRWTAPHVSYQNGLSDVALTGEKSTTVEVVES